MTSSSCWAQFTVEAGTRTANHPNVGGFGFAWYINGIESPELFLNRGQTYTFTLNNVPSLHPFYISTGDVGGGASPYTAGLSPVPPVSGSTVLTFTVPTNAPNTLYYQCMTHIRMGWKLTMRTATISGTVALSDFTPGPSGQAVTFEVFQGSTLVDTQTATLGSGGSFSIPTFKFGTLNVAAKASHWLRKVVSGVTVGNNGASGVAFTLTNGDVDNDNEVGPGDFGGLSAAFGSVAGDGNWNAMADLDGDGEVGPSDFGVLSANFGMSGD